MLKKGFNQAMGCLNLLVIHYKKLRGNECVFSDLAVSRMIVESALSIRISPSLLVLDGRRKMHKMELYKVDSIRYMHSLDNKYTRYILLCYTLPMWSISQITYNTDESCNYPTTQYIKLTYL